MSALGVGDVPGADIGVVEFEVCALVELEPEKPVCRIEACCDHGLEFEVLANFALVKVIAGGAFFFRVVAPVPSGDLELSGVLVVERP